jgi:hypothetical protein
MKFALLKHDSHYFPNKKKYNVLLTIAYSATIRATMVPISNTKPEIGTIVFLIVSELIVVSTNFY